VQNKALKRFIIVWLTNQKKEKKMNNCECKHADICSIKPTECTLDDESKIDNGDVLPGYSSSKISAMQGRPEKDLT